MPFQPLASPLATPEHLIDEHGWQCWVVTAVLLVDFLQDGAQQFQVVMGGVLEFLDQSGIRGLVDNTGSQFMDGGG